MSHPSRRTLLARAAALCALPASAALAQAPRAAWPNRPITLVVPFPPGGATDLMARSLGQRFTRAWGQPVTIENKPGAGGMLAAAQVAKAGADGHTLFFGAGAQLAVNPSLYASVPYDTARDFAPVALVGSVPNLLVAHPSQPYAKLADLIQAAKAQPGKLSYASPGSGSTAHLAMELLKVETGLDIVHVPYKGAAGGVTDVLGNQVPLMIVSMPSVVGHVKTGKLVALGITDLRRSPALPEVPPFADTLPGFEATGWYGLVAPAQTPPAIVQQLGTEVNAALQDPEVRRSFESQGIQVLGSSPEQFAAHIAAETRKWATVIAKARIKAD
jgi:tripartite-type tricarboxylate transporter receptor subunit TctC